MALRVVAVGLVLLIWSALTVVAKVSPASAPGPAYYDYAPAAAPASGDIIYGYYNVPSDVEALTRIMGTWNQTNPNLASLLPGWSVYDVQPCISGIWMGVFCWLDFDNSKTQTIDGYNVTMVPVWVMGLAITNTDLMGILPPEVGDLLQLTYIYVTGTKLSGPIPNTFAKLSFLDTLDLHSNNFNGSIPPELGNVISLTQLDLSNNRLTGNIPSNLGNALTLYSLKLFQNQLSGNIPGKFSGDGPGFSNMQYLVSLELMENSLTGSLPDLRNSLMLTILNVSHNLLSGPVVLESFLNVTSRMSRLDLSSNWFTGLLPDLSNFTSSLNKLDLGNNPFEATTLPSWLNVSNQLQNLGLANISLFGSVPTYFFDIQSLSKLEYLDLEGNKLEGTLDLSKILQNGSVTLKFVNLLSNNIKDILYQSNLLTNNDFTGHVHYMLEDNPYCGIIKSMPDMTFAKAFFCNDFSVISTNQGRLLVITLTTSMASGVLFLVAIISLFLYMRHKGENKRLLGQIQLEFAKSDVQPTLYTYNELKVATKNFSPDLKLGQGAFGVVYKGVQSNGSELAIKYLLGKSQQHIDEFLNEVVLITGIRHKNLVKLKGCCIHDKKRLLVYEYVENNNLSEVLFDGIGQHDLNWEVRCNICLGIAQGLHYLHEIAQPRIIHRDIKGPNIMLNKNLNAKIADFGLARLFPDEGSHVSTLHIAGTPGYLAPEYALRGELTEKADVYSYGVLVFEILSGRKNIDFATSAEDVYLIDLVWRLHEEGKLMDIVDTSMNISGHEAEVHRVMNIALLCVQTSGPQRPSMGKVVSMLKGESEVEVVIQASAYNTQVQYEAFLSIMRSRAMNINNINTSASMSQHNNLKDLASQPLCRDLRSSRTISLASTSKTLSSFCP